MDASPFLDPPLSLATQAFLRVAYGLLLVGTLCAALPQAPRFFTTATYGGYLNPGALRDRLFAPRTLPVLLGVWIASALALIAGVATPLAALVNLALCYYWFVHTRWKGILRGMGAPGLMCCWLAACIFFLEYALHHDPTGRLRAAAVLAFRVDFAVIMLVAGIYKATAGYPRNQGMEFGMVNPWWGYWWRFYRGRPPGHVLFRVLNHLAYSVEIAAGVLLLIPATRQLGALAIIGSFVFIATHIRLGFLCEMVIVAALVCIEPGTLTDRALAAIAGTPAAPATTALAPAFDGFLRVALLAYVCLLPFAQAGMHHNFYGRKRLPGPLQAALERYCNLFGLTLWRVFTVDVICFFVEVHLRNPRTGEMKLFSQPGRLDWASRFRYLHVGEFVCCASIFTALKYFASNPELFRARLLRYARSIPCAEGWQIRFIYVMIEKSGTGFEFVPVSEFDVDPRAGTLEERALKPEASLRGAHAASPVHEGAAPGSYAPAECAAGSVAQG